MAALPTDPVRNTYSYSCATYGAATFSCATYRTDPARCANYALTLTTPGTVCTIPQSRQN